MLTYFVDSFTKEKFKGNPAAICFPNEVLANATMQQIATEIGFSETGFVRPINGNNYSIRFFTPKMEIPLCGHATLAAAKLIFDSTSFSSVKFINVNKVELLVEKAGNRMKMQFPLYETEDVEIPELMVKALGISRVLNKRYNKETKIVLIEIESCKELGGLVPEYDLLKSSYAGIDGVLVTARADQEPYDFHYRYFWPWAGTNEDPVTGAVQTFLTKYWANKLNKTKLEAFQSSERTGTMSTELNQNSVFILGEAVTVLEGQFKI